jgi:hypothetical protein
MKLKSAVLVNALRAAFKQLNVMTQSSVNIGQTVFKAEQGNFLLFANYFDNLNVSDQAGAEDALHYHLARAFNIDNPEVADLYAATFHKPFASAGAVTDKDVIRFIKGAVEEVLFSEDLYREFSKALTDIVASVEDHAVLLNKKVADNTADVADVDTLDVGKVTADASALTDDSIWAYGKVTEDTPILSDGIETKGVTKSLTDAVDATDDVDGIASILDDQEMQFRKVTTHTAALTDTFYRQISFVREFVDSSNITDVDTFALSKPFTDNSSITDNDTIDIGKPITEAPAVADSFASSFGRPLSDSSALTDEDVWSLDKPITDNSSVADSTYVLTGKQISDISVFTDTLARSFGQSLSDSSALTDDDVWSFGKSATDSTSFTDAGSLRSQGYSDFAYFEEDFVGASKTF